jgi:hypothetical protein
VNRWLRAASWVLFAGVMYLILTGALWPWIQLPDLGNVGFTVVFVLFAVVHCAAMEGASRTLVFLPHLPLFPDLTQSGTGIVRLHSRGKTA